jgi:hypothetical protein
MQGTIQKYVFGALTKRNLVLWAVVAQVKKFNHIYPCRHWELSSADNYVIIANHTPHAAPETPSISPSHPTSICSDPCHISTALFAIGPPDIVMFTQKTTGSKYTTAPLDCAHGQWCMHLHMPSMTIVLRMVVC